MVALRAGSVAACRSLCRKHGQQKEIAELLGVRPAYINDIIKGRKKPTGEFFLRAAQVGLLNYLVPEARDVGHELPERGTPDYAVAAEPASNLQSCLRTALDLAAELEATLAIPPLEIVAPDAVKNRMDDLGNHAEAYSFVPSPGDKTLKGEIRRASHAAGVQASAF